MQLHCFGTAGYHSSESRHTSSYYLPESGIALDAGSGFFRLGESLKIDSLDILITHAHLDHILGLTYLLDATLFKRPTCVRIWGEAEKLRAIRDHLFHPLLFPAPLNAEWHEISVGDHWKIGNVDVTCRGQQHPGGSLAYRLDWPTGKRLVYCTDTTGDTSQVHADWSRHADLLIHECYFPDSNSQWAETTGHSWTSRVVEVAKGSQPKQLLLTHLNPSEESLPESEVTKLRQQLDADVVVASDHLCVEF